MKEDMYNVQIKGIEYKIADVTGITTINTLNVNINEVKNKAPNITNLATNNALALLKIKYLVIVNISLLKLKVK